MCLVAFVVVVVVVVAVGLVGEGLVVDLEL